MNEELSDPVVEASRELRILLAGVSEVIKRENKKYLLVVFVLIILSGFVSILSTTGVVSVCFLGGLDTPGICKTIPGYAESEENNKILLKQFEELQKITEQNQHRIEELEKQNGR